MRKPLCFISKNIPSFDWETCRWLHFRHYRNRGSSLVGFLPCGKLVLPDHSSEIHPVMPGYYLAALVKEHANVAFAKVVRAHRNLKFNSNQAFGPTNEGITLLLSYRRRRQKRLRFVCDPNHERLEIFGYDTVESMDKAGAWKYYSFRHGRWQLLNFRGPRKIGVKDFEEAERRVLEFKQHGHYMDSSDNTVWSDALKARIITEEEYDEAHRLYGRMWTYVGD